MPKREHTGIHFERASGKYFVRTNIPGHPRQFVGRYKDFESALAAQVLAGMAIVSKQFLEYSKKMNELQIAQHAQ